MTEPPNNHTSPLELNLMYKNGFYNKNGRNGRVEEVVGETHILFTKYHFQ